MINHPNIVRCSGAFYKAVRLADQKHVYVAMEYMELGSLSLLYDAWRPLSEDVLGAIT